MCKHGYLVASSFSYGPFYFGRRRTIKCKLLQESVDLQIAAYSVTDHCFDNKQLLIERKVLLLCSHTAPRVLRNIFSLAQKFQALRSNTRSPSALHCSSTVSLNDVAYTMLLA
jgi:hypothetical protein